MFKMEKYLDFQKIDTFNTFQWNSEFLNSKHDYETQQSSLFYVVVVYFGVVRAQKLAKYNI